MIICYISLFDQDNNIFVSESDSFEFQIVSLDGKQWSFESALEEERDEWVTLIEQAILECLQNLDIRRSPLINNCGNMNENHGSKFDLNESGDKDATGKSLSPTAEGVSDVISDADARKKMIQEISFVSGNDFCADCGQPSTYFINFLLLSIDLYHFKYHLCLSEVPKFFHAETLH